MIYSVLRRTLREGVSFDEFRTAWAPPSGLDHATFTVVHAQSITNPREILSIGMHDMTADEFAAFSTSADFARVNAERHERIAPLIEEDGGFLGAYETVEGDRITL